MFSHPQNKLNMFEAMNSGSIVLINTAKDLLKQQGTEIFGRFMIALISQATQERSAIPEKNRLPTYVYIDEAQDYLGTADELFQELVSQARKFRVALTISHQSLTRLSKPVQDAVMACAATKIIGGASMPTSRSSQRRSMRRAKTC